MQSWPSSGQQDGNGADSWQQNYSYPGQNPPFDPNQQWAQPGNNNQARQYQQVIPQGDANPNYYDPNVQPSAYAQGTMTGHQNQANFHGGLPITQEFPQHGLQTVDPSFSNVYGQPTNANGRDSISSQQAQPHAQPQGYGRSEVTFAPQGNQGYQQQHHHQQQQYQQAVQQRQTSHTPDQQYSHPSNNANNAQFQHMNNANIQQQQQQYQQQMYGAQGQLNPQQALQHQQQQLQHHPHPQQHKSPSPQQQPQQTHPSKAAFHQHAPANSHVAIAPASANPQPQALSHPVTKPRSVSATESIASVSDTGIDASTKKVSDVNTLNAPISSADETQLLENFRNRTGEALHKYPSIPGAPHLAFDGSAVLPTPKSYDKLAPMIAMPSQSGNPMAPELGHDLPCEIQGKFSSQYQPAATKSGLEERKAESQGLLDSFEASMTALGKRRPKYTEYPHSFKEQIKSDEASKNKKAKKESASKPVRPAVRPTDVAAAAAWDAVGIVHIEDASTPTSSVIAQRVQQAGDFFIKLRTEMNKSKTELEQAIKDGAAEADLAKKKEEAEQKKEALFKALDATVEHADDAIMDNLGGHHKLVLSLVNALISSIKANDFSGKLPKIVLELFTHFRMTKKIAEATNFETVRKRFEDKGDEDAKAFAREIATKVKKVLKGSEAETATGYTGTSAASRAKTSTKAESAPGKRARDDDVDAARTVKKIAVESGAGALSKKLAAPKAAAPASKTASILPGKSRTAVKPVSKPEAPNGDSPPAVSEEPSKKVAPKAEKPPAPKMAAAPSSSALSGIASLLDSINAPKAELPAADTTKEGSDSDNNETPAEAARRLRKEARRKLTVKWKADEELVQIRIFHKDDNEDEGRAVNMTKDAGDDKSEGMVLKRRADIEEDDDDDDIPYQPWTEPIETDFTSLPEDVRSKNYVNRAGSVTFSTDEQGKMADREQKELMAIYAMPEDIPPTPRSPLPETISAAVNAVQLPQEDKFAEVRKRWTDSEQMGPDGALYAAMGRLDSRKRPSSQLNSILSQVQDAASQASPATPITSITVTTSQTNIPLVSGPTAAEAVLAWLKSEKLKTWQDPAPIQPDLSRPYHYSDPSAQAAGNLIEVLVRYLASKPFPATSPPDWMLQDEQKAKEWWFGYNKEVAAKQRKADEERALNAVASSSHVNSQDAASYYAQQQAYAPYMSILQQMAGGQQSAPSQQSQIDDNQMQSILAAINQGPPQSGTVPPPPPPPLNPNDPSYQQLLMLSQMAQGQAGASQPTQVSEPDGGRDRDQYRDRDWDRSRDRDRNEGQSGREDYRDYRKKKPTLPPHKPVNKALIGTKACTFWQQGKCARGDQCTFRHD